jgi:homocysteine S-methyltransferase
VDVIGLNCGMGPNHVLNALEKMRRSRQRNFLLNQNAGLPRDVQGRQFYMGSPDYKAEFSRRFVQAEPNSSAAAVVRHQRTSS